MNKKYFALIVAGVLLLPGSAAAHVLKTDGNIGILMHVDPNDDPTEGQAATFFLQIKDKTNAFDPDHCICTIKIVDVGKVISSEFFEPSADLSAASIFTFPHAGIYQAVVTGEPSTPGQFQSFSITFDQRVERASESDRDGVPTVMLGMAGVLFVLLCAYAFIKLVPKKPKV